MQEQKKENAAPDTDMIAKQLEECEKQKNEYLAGWQRARADFLNHKKEEMERMQEIIAYSKEEFILRILPIVDSFTLAEKNITDPLKCDNTTKGFLQIKAQLLDFLRQAGVEEITAIGCAFDPNYHEIVEQKQSEAESGTILEEAQKGYVINGKVLRPSKVKVAQ